MSETTKQSKLTSQDLLDILRDRELHAKDWLEECEEKGGMSVPMFYRLLESLKKDEKVVRSDTDGKYCKVQNPEPDRKPNSRKINDQLLDKLVTIEGILYEKAITGDLEAIDLWL